MRGTFKNLLKGRQEGAPKAKISKPTGALDIYRNEHVCVFVVGPSFDQSVPNAMVTYRMGYANAYEAQGIPYVFVDQQDLPSVLKELTKPFCMINGSDYIYMNNKVLKTLRKVPHTVWVDPWFKNSDKFFLDNNLDANIWRWSTEHRNKILFTEPTFVHTATVESGLNFFEEWSRCGLNVRSLPLACDTKLYQPDGNFSHEFADVRMAFVGGYWETKGRQIDLYLRPFEDQLTIYGYSPWPYSGYRGLLPRGSEPALYRQAKLSPVINEPSVKILHGQINERIFKVLGSGGRPLVDAIPYYRELFTSSELDIPEDAEDFKAMAESILHGDISNDHFTAAREAVFSRHTYLHRAKFVIHELGLQTLN